MLLPLDALRDEVHATVPDVVAQPVDQQLRGVGDQRPVELEDVRLHERQQDGRSRAQADVVDGDVQTVGACPVDGHERAQRIGGDVPLGQLDDHRELALRPLGDLGQVNQVRGQQTHRSSARSAPF